jgi:hypothetical protein
MADDRIPISRDERLARARPKSASLSWPIPVDGYLDELLEIVEDDGERTSRKELLAALVFATEPDTEALVRALHDYRRATVADLVDRLGAPDALPDNVVEFPRRGAGPRPR